MPRNLPSRSRHKEAERLKKLRIALDMTQRELAIEFKVAPGAIAQWETSERTIPGPVLRLIEIYEGKPFPKL